MRGWSSRHRRAPSRSSWGSEPCTACPSHRTSQHNIIHTRHTPSCCSWPLTTNTRHNTSFTTLNLFKNLRLPRPVSRKWNRGVFVKKWKTGGFFVKKVDLSLNAGCIKYSISIFFILHFTYLDGAYTPNAPPAYGPVTYRNGLFTLETIKHSKHTSTISCDLVLKMFLNDS